MPYLLLFHLLFLCSSASAATRDGPTHDLVHSSCLHASYPNVCLRTLSSYGGAAKTPCDLAQAAVNISLSRSQRLSGYLAQVGETMTKREKLALNDCLEQISDSVDELSRTLKELKHLGDGESFQWHMSNAQTWVSAALTNDDTCLDGFDDVEGKTKGDVKRKINSVAKVTSNALYMINRLDESRGSGRGRGSGRAYVHP